MQFKFLSRAAFSPADRRSTKLLNYLFGHHQPSSTMKLPKHPPPLPRAPDILPSQTVVFDVEGWLLRSPSTFPYFMLVAFEAGGLFRALLLLLLYPLLCLTGSDVATKVMVMVCFFGVRKNKCRIGAAVLSKWLMEDTGEEGFEVVRKGGRRVGVSSMPRVMVESFLKDYLEIEEVIGRELKEFHGFYTGFMEETGEEDGKKKMMMMMINGGEELVGLGCCDQVFHHKAFLCCKEIHRVSNSEKNRWRPLPREKYPKPLIFHDGRLAFRPTPTATLAMVTWLPFAIALSIYRTTVTVLLPSYISLPNSALTGLKYRIFSQSPQPPHKPPPKTPHKTPESGRLYICNHRTLLDPIFIAASLNKQLVAAIYSLSPVTEFISPIKTARLTRNKEEDRRKMAELLKQGDLVVCPEGTTCREPYLLRFSPLFAELADEITPVAVEVDVSMFYGTTARGFKCLDSFFFSMNPRPMYALQFLERISVVSEKGGSFNPYKTANLVQREIGRCLGFECTALTRKDKYQMLAGNDGVVRGNNRLSQHCKT